jgi:hypothetical protein
MQTIPGKDHFGRGDVMNFADYFRSITKLFPAPEILYKLFIQPLFTEAFLELQASYSTSTYLAVSHLHHASASSYILLGCESRPRFRPTLEGEEHMSDPAEQADSEKMKQKVEEVTKKSKAQNREGGLRAMVALQRY